MSAPAVRRSTSTGPVGLPGYPLLHAGADGLRFCGSFPHPSLPLTECPRGSRGRAPLHRSSRAAARPHPPPQRSPPQQSPPQQSLVCRSLAQPARQKSGSGAPRRPLPLRNFGNTCYLNATMQCVVHTPGLLADVAEVLTRAVERRRPAAQALVGFDAPTMSNMAQLLLTVKGEAANFNEEFRGNNQADAHEFLRTFLFVLHSEINRREGRKEPYQEMKDIENEGEDAAMRRWQSYLNRVDSSSIYDIYGGVTRSKCICLDCGHTSLTFDPFLDLSLPVPNAPRSPVSIENLISSNFNDGEENLCGGNKLLCARCKRMCNGKRFIKVMQWPKVLVLQLKRFCMSGRKNKAPIIYPKTFVTCSEHPKTYQLFGVVCHQGSESWGHYTSYVCVPTPGRSGSSNRSGMHSASSVVGPTHLPQLAQLQRRSAFASFSCDSNDEYGTSYAPCESWYFCNDGEISAVDVVSVTKALTQAYILFYAEV